MNDNEAKRLAAKMLKQTALIEPGTTMFVIVHTGDEGLVPPPEQGSSEEGGFEGVGSGDGHAFGPFVTENEAAEWQRVADIVRPCPCRKALIEIIVPRILGIIGPAGVPIPNEDPTAKDRLN